MKVVGLVTEYNPFHNGHKYHLEASKQISEANYVVCVMSGNFIQRGEPALINKWARTRMALSNGADLVIELPVSYVLQSAEHFSFGAIKILDSLNIVDTICFGSELGKIEPLKLIASILANEPEELSNKIKQILNEGINYPKAREKAMKDYLMNTSSIDKLDNIMSSPNNILGIEYIKALYKLNSSIAPLTLKRYKAGYDTPHHIDEIASATAIRRMLEKRINIKPFLPASSYDILKSEIDAGKGPVLSRHFDNAILTILRKLSAVQLSAFPNVNEGLENRIYKASLTYGTLEDLLSSIKTKRYTRTRLQRIMFNILIGINQAAFGEFEKHGGPQYIRVLGMNDKGKQLLKIAQVRSSLPIIVKPASYQKSCNPILKKMIEFDFIASDLYALHYRAENQRLGLLDYTTSPIIL